MSSTSQPGPVRDERRPRRVSRCRVSRRWLAAGGAAAVVVIAATATAIGGAAGTRDTGGGGHAGDGVATSTASQPQDRAAGSGSGGDPGAVVAKATGVLPAVYNRVGRGLVGTSPQAITGQPALTAGGKPLIVYIGAEHCSRSAGLRWAIVTALSRFGTFTSLGLTSSAGDGDRPGIPSLSFHGTSYTSRYLAFQGVETASNTRRGDRYAPLDTLTGQQQKLMDTLNAPPYLPSKGTLPFLDLANRYLLAGDPYDVTLLAGKSAEQVANALGNPSSPIAQSVIGTANMLTARLCEITNGQPGEVCQSTAAKAHRGSP